MSPAPGQPPSSRALASVLAGLAVLALGALVAVPVLGYREGPPADRVGACGFGPSCWDIGCHQSYPIDTAELPWRLEQQAAPLPPGYVGGRSYDLKLTIDERANPFASVYGFELSPMLDCPFSTAGGDVVPVDTGRTQRIVSGGLPYLTHSCLCVTEDPACCGYRPPVEAYLIDWSFVWIAPPPGSGAVTFYMGFNAANWDGTPNNDRITLGSVPMPEDATCPPVVTDLRLALAPCDPGAPGVPRLALGWTRGGASFRVRSTNDVAASPADRALWTDAGTSDCLAIDASPLVFYSVAEECGTGQEGPH